MQPQTKSLRSTIYAPTTSLSGDEQPSVFRGQNLVLRGNIDNPYFEAFAGNLDLGEDYDLAEAALTGTLTFTANSHTVSGSGTSFRTELHLGQLILAGTQVLAVQEVVSDTSFRVDRAPTTSESGLTGYRMHQISEVNGKRCVMFTGNAIQFGKGHYVAVGSGPMRINGAALPGTSLIATAKAKAAIYRPATNDYIVVPLGYPDPPPQPTVEVVTGGTKGMVDLNKFSFMFSYWSGQPEGTNGFSDPCDAVKLDINGVPIQINGTLNQFRVNFTTSLAGIPSWAKGFRIWGSQSGKSQKSVSGATITVTSPNQTQYENGPWFKIKDVLLTDLTSNHFDFEYLDGDVGAEVTGGNDAPVGAEFVSKIEGRPMIISCLGKATTSEGNGSNPGPSILVGKFDNPDAFPEEWSASIDGDIIGTFDGVGRWFVTTSNSIQFVVSTGNYGQLSAGGQTVELPIISRPYWKSGAANRYSIMLVDETLYGRSGGKFFQSVGYGDENVKKYDFGGVVQDIAGDWSDGHVLAGNDPRNTQVCFFNSAAHKNAQGYWVSQILPYSLFNQAWLPMIELSSPTGDMIVSGVATVQEKLEFLCGGRTAAGPKTLKTYRFAAGTGGTTVPYYLIWQISDDGVENQSKQIHSIRPTGKFTGLNIQIHGAKPGQKISTVNMEDGAATVAGAYFSGNIAIPNSSVVTRYLPRKVKINNLATYAVRISGTWDGTGTRDRIDEVVLNVSIKGARDR